MLNNNLKVLIMRFYVNDARLFFKSLYNFTVA